MSVETRWALLMLAGQIAILPWIGAAAEPLPGRLVARPAPARTPEAPRQEFAARRAALTAGDVDARHDLGLWCLRNELPDAAVAVLGEAVGLAPGNVYVRFHLARACVAARSYAKAREHFDEAVRQAAAMAPGQRGPAALQEQVRRWRDLAEARALDARWGEASTRTVRDLLVAATPVRIFVDRSKWAHGWDILDSPRAEPAPNHTELKNYDRITWDHLRHADVCAVLTKNTVFLGDRGERVSLDYSPEEVDAIKEFVERGGGLLLGCDGAQWASSNVRCSELAKTRPLRQEEMPINRIAGAFGIQFTDRPVSRADTATLKVAEHACFGEFPPRRVEAAVKSGILRQLESRHRNTDVLIRFGRRGRAAVAVSYGKGRVFAIGTHENWCADQAEGHRLAEAVCQWLGANRLSLDYGQQVDGDTRWFESSTFVDEGIFRIAYNPQLAYKVPAFRDRVRVVSRFVSTYLGVELQDHFPERFVLRMLPAFGGGAAGAQINIAVLGEAEDTTGLIAHEMAHRVTRRAFGPLEEYFSRWMGIQARHHYGEHAAAAAELQAELEAYRKADPMGRDLDLSRTGGRAAQGKAIWVFKTLEEEFGQSFFRKYLEAVQQDPARPRTITVSDVVRYMSQAAGEDLRLWFRRIGTTLSD